MRFVYDGDYVVKDGVTFIFRNPVEVENKRTIETLLKDPLFRKVEDEKEAEAHKTEVLEKDACPKCGRIVKQGRFMHEKWCKGPQ